MPVCCCFLFRQDIGPDPAALLKIFDDFHLPFGSHPFGTLFAALFLVCAFKIMLMKKWLKAIAFIEMLL